MIDKQYDEQIKKWLADNRDWLIEEWIELAKIPAIKSKAEKGAPFGKECARALCASAALFKKKGFDTTVYDESGYALAKYGDKDRTMGLFAHSDVVPVGDGWIHTEPFNPVVKDNTLIGRSVSDNKSGVMLSLAVMMMTRDLNLPVNVNLQTFIGSNEETGMQDVEAFAKEQPMPEISLVPDACFPCSAGEKGIWHFWAVSKKKFNTIKEFCGGEAFNIVLDNALVKIDYNAELMEELMSKADGDSRYGITEADGYIVLKTKGVAKHAATPAGSENAVYYAAKLLAECDNMDASDKEILLSVAKLTESGFGEGMNLTNEDKYFGKLTAANGMVKCEDSMLSLSFDTRYGIIGSEKVKSIATESLSELGFDIHTDEDSPGFSLDENGAVGIFAKVYNELTGKNKDIIYMGGGTYARKLKNAISVGTEEGRPNNFQMPKGHGEAHQCDEMIDLDGFFEAVRIVMHYILSYK